MIDIYLRELCEQDALVSYQWRNDPEVWKFTGRRPDKTITKEIELEWIRNVLTRNYEKRFAICVKDTNQYIGNVQLTAINGFDAKFHIFIGERTFWGKGIAQSATALITKYAFGELNLQSVFLDVKKENIAAIRAYEKAGYKEIFQYDEYIRMAVYASDEFDKKVSVFMMTYNHELFIEQALNGILNQQVEFNYDIVVGDDFSTDRTREIVLDFATRNPGKFKLLFYPKNISALNNQFWVLKNCKGTLIAFCEGDDYWTDSQKLKKQVALLEKNQDCSIVWTNFKKESNRELKPEEFDVKYTNGLYKIELNTVFIPYVTLTLTCLLRRNVLDIDLLGKMKYAKDNTLYAMALTKGYGFLMEDVTAVYRVHAGGIFSMKANFFQSFSSYLNFKEIVKFYPQLRELNNFTDVRRGLFYFSLRYFFSERRYLKFGNKYSMQFLGQFFSKDSLSIIKYFLRLKIKSLFEKKHNN